MYTEREILLWIIGVCILVISILWMLIKKKNKEIQILEQLGKEERESNWKELDHYRQSENIRRDLDSLIDSAKFYLMWRQHVLLDIAVLNGRVVLVLCDNSDAGTLYAANAGNIQGGMFWGTRINMKIRGDAIYIMDIVGPENMGYGSLLMEVLIRYAKERQIKLIHGKLVRCDADTQEHLERRNHFYKKFGFKVECDENGEGKVSLLLEY